jgi:hypothetical protein
MQTGSSQEMWYENVKGKCHLEDLGTDRNIILKQILKR